MDKFERTMVVVLVAALLGWMMLSRKMAPPPLPEDAMPGPTVPTAVTNEMVRTVVTNVPVGIASPVAAVVADDEPVRMQAENTVVLRNDNLELYVSSWGGGFSRVALTAYPATGAHDEEPLTYEFDDRPALSISGIRGLGAGHDFAVEQNGERHATVRRRTIDGLEFERRITLGDGYDVAIEDTLSNSSEAPLAVTNLTLALGELPAVVSQAKASGYSYLGVDTLSPEGEVVVWGKKLNALFGVRGGCSRPDLRGVPPTVALPVGQPCVWVAAKNKFFTQIVVPEAGAEGCVIRAARSMAATNQFVLGSVAADVALENRVLSPGGTYTRSYAYYIGPKKFSQLRSLGQKQDAVMFKTWPGFGWWRWACLGLLGLLNGIYAIIPNYGVAIILLTILVKVVFWPVTHKGNLHMKKMQSIQPELTKLREKHKGNPKKMQQAQMELYRKHGVNPLAGCLPMFVQIPIFIALFTVLRSAVELRFAGFLWISDLSEPEMLFANVLPIVIAASTFLGSMV